MACSAEAGGPYGAGPGKLDAAPADQPDRPTPQEAAPDPAPAPSKVAPDPDADPDSVQTGGKIVLRDVDVAFEAGGCKVRVHGRLSRDGEIARDEDALALSAPFEVRCAVGKDVLAWQQDLVPYLHPVNSLHELPDDRPRRSIFRVDVGHPPCTAPTKCELVAKTRWTTQRNDGHKDAGELGTFCTDGKKVAAGKCPAPLRPTARAAVTDVRTIRRVDREGHVSYRVSMRWRPESDDPPLVRLWARCRQGVRTWASDAPMFSTADLPSSWLPGDALVLRGAVFVADELKRPPKDCRVTVVAETLASGERSLASLAQFCGRLPGDLEPCATPTPLPEPAHSLTASTSTVERVELVSAKVPRLRVQMKVNGRVDGVELEHRTVCTRASGEIAVPAESDETRSVGSLSAAEAGDTLALETKLSDLKGDDTPTKCTVELSLVGRDTLPLSSWCFPKGMGRGQPCT